MTDRAAFLAAIIAAPDDDAPRLIFADWLDDNGESERAEFIRVGVELAGFENDAACRETCQPPDFEGCPNRELRRRERALLNHISTEGIFWSLQTRFGGGGCSWVYRRGFIAEISCTVADFMAHAEALFRAAPIERVTLTDAEPRQSEGLLPPLFGWHSPGMTPPGADDLPRELMEHMDFTIILHRCAYFPTRQAALDALSTAAVAYGRRLAGLPTA